MNSSPVAVKSLWPTKSRRRGGVRRSRRLDTVSRRSSARSLADCLARSMTGLRKGGGPYNPCPHERPPTAGARSPLDDAHLRGALDREGLQRAVPEQPRQGPDGPLGGV